jgi:bifunctional pyridoxal-dependent enzyme with beta-cystathionase and maltose regulon repressor activities
MWKEVIEKLEEVQELLQRHGVKIVKDEKEEVFWRVQT